MPLPLRSRFRLAIVLLLVSAGISAHPAEGSRYLVEGPANPTPTQFAELARTSCDVRVSHVCARAVVDGHRLTAISMKATPPCGSPASIPPSALGPSAAQRRTSARSASIACRSSTRPICPHRYAARQIGAVLGDYRRDGTVRDKYNVVSGSDNIAVAAG